MYKQILDPIADSLGWSALLAALPLVLLFVLLGVFRVRAWAASLLGLGAAILVAAVGYGMPWGQVLLAGSEGAAFGLFPAMWIVANAIWVYEMTRRSGHFDVLKRSFSSISPDRRIQGMIIAFCFGALLEALAGFGAPVAICSVMLVALGLSPLKAATTALVANTAPVAYGAVALPIITLAKVADLPTRDLAQMTGRQVPILAVVVPFLLLFLLDGRRGLRQLWPAGLVCGLSFAIVQFAMANYGPVQLSDIAASLVSAAATLLFLRYWRTPEVLPVELDGDDAGAVPAGGTTPGAGSVGTLPRTRPSAAARVAVQRDPAVEQLKAFAPYIVVVALFSIVAIPAVSEQLARTTRIVQWPGLHLVNSAGKPLTLTSYKLDWLVGGGTVLLVSGLITAAILRLSPTVVLRCYGAVLRQVRAAGVTVMSVLALSYVMNASGMTVTMAAWLAGAGSAFAVLSPVLGWFGTAVTGSDTSSNSLFGALQVQAAQRTGLDPVLLAAANSSGGVLGKMLSPQNLAIGASAVGLSGREGELFRRVLAATAILLPLLCVVVVLQATSVLSWLVP
ncbi:lactate permease [Jatrophihabitans endophyticus]|uniref:L-lactate permease n=1 Tax=Jatrophihabitans endophyticus TaxID=1206085 RepID=A0A1M5Q231_9ACTN|nr:L-lactate permease [Jatrophihabitans endophyticus]SHH08337.1 lactate permease [Jatrophihabitans endophyticus]